MLLLRVATQLRIINLMLLKADFRTLFLVGWKGKFSKFKKVKAWS